MKKAGNGEKFSRKVVTYLNSELRDDIDSILLEVIKRSYPKPGTDLVKIGNFAYLIDHSRHSELDNNRKDGRDGFGIRAKFDARKLTPHDYKAIERITGYNVHPSDQSVIDDYEEIIRNARTNGRGLPFSTDDGTAILPRGLDVQEDESTSGISGDLGEGRRSEGEVFSLKQTHSDNFKKWFGDWEKDSDAFILELLLQVQRYNFFSNSQLKGLDSRTIRHKLPAT